MSFLSKIVKENSNSTFEIIRGVNGKFSTNFEVGKNIYVLKVHHIIFDNLRKSDFTFDRKTNKLICKIDKRYSGSARFIIRWKESNNFKRINL
jgi:hypothetical protein